VIELADAQSPKHVENFLRYVDTAFYSDTVFHRVVAGRIVQGGGVDKELRGRPTLPPVANESRNGLSNVRGSVAAARLQSPDSATAQFFVNLADNAEFDAGADFGYTVFGKVKTGIEVLDGIGRLPTSAQGPFPADVPTPLVTIRSMARLDSAVLDALPAEGRDAALKERIAAAVAAQDYAGAAAAVGHYRAACGANDSAITVVEAKAALELGRGAHARAVLEQYFANTEEDDPKYADALALYRVAVPENLPNAAQLADDCEAPTAPALPDGSTATQAEMVSGQTLVRAYVTSGETYLACLGGIIDTKERSAEDRNAAVAEHNRMVGSMEQVAAAFNAQVRIFKAR
jgi:peptidyl-prolyl cis-trans isomerase A (cyclophilin A)/peptidyl-prolyl cis-trans isomerase B (cyclophilin B)